MLNSTQAAFQSAVEPIASVFLRYCRLVKAKHTILLLRNSYLFKIPNLQSFSYSRKEHTESTCYFFVNRRGRIAYSEYQIAYSEYRISYSVYFYVNAALSMRIQIIYEFMCKTYRTYSIFVRRAPCDNFLGWVHIEIYRGIRYSLFSINLLFGTCYM